MKQIFNQTKVLTVGCILALVVLLSSCATTQEKALGKVARPASPGGVTVYFGTVNRKHRVIKKMRERRKQIHGPNYYDFLSGTAWMSVQGNSLGADAVINYGDKRIPGKILILDPGHFEAWGTAIKFVN